MEGDQEEAERKFKSITTNVDPELYERIEADAKAEERSMSNFVKTILKRHYNGDECLPKAS